MLPPPITSQRVVRLQNLGDAQRAHPASLQTLQNGDGSLGNLSVDLLHREDLVAQQQGFFRVSSHYLLFLFVLCFPSIHHHF